MRNRLTFANVIGVLLENKKKTYPQHQLVRSLFSAYLDDTLTASELIADDTTMYSRWCNGARPIPIDILKTYEDEDEWDTMEDDFRDKIIPNLLNEAQARIQMEELITDSIKTIGQEMADALIQEPDNAAFFCSVVRYAILNDHSTGALYSPDLSEVILCNKLPSCNQAFIGRKDEIKAIASHLSNQSVLFITGMAGIGKSEVAKAYAQTNRKKYTNIIYLYYTGDLRKDIANLTFADDSVEMNEEVRFQNHYKVMQRLHTDTLLILDNFNVLPKDEPFLKELMKNDMQLLITSRCKLKNYDSIEIKELDKEKELTELFYKHCPSAKRDPDSVSAIIEEVNCHTLTVCMAALTLEASGMEPEELLQELRSCGIGQNMEEIEVFKDDEFSYASMIGHLRMLMKLNRLNEDSIDILRNLSLLPVSGVYKSAFKMWLELDSLKNVNELIRYGIISEDTENKTIALHPLIQEVAIAETIPTVSDCHVMLNHLHLICLAHGLDVKRPVTVMECLKSINRHIILDNRAYYLLFLQDMYPYFDKYLDTDYLSELVERIEYVMNLMNDSGKSDETSKSYNSDKSGTPDITQETNHISACDKALLLDYKAQLLFPRKEFEAPVIESASTCATDSGDVALDTPTIYYESWSKNWSVTCGGHWKNNEYGDSVGNVGGADGFGVGYTNSSNKYSSKVMSASAYMTDVNSNYRASTSNRSDGDGSKGFGFRIQDHWKSGYYVGHKWSGLCTYDRWFGNYNGVATAYYIHTYDSASLESVSFGFDGKTAGISADITNSVKSFTAFSADKSFGVYP